MREKRLRIELEDSDLNKINVNKTDTIEFKKFLKREKDKRDKSIESSLQIEKRIRD